MGLHAFAGHTPQVAADAFIAPGAQLIGDVRVGAGASVWYNCVLRGDLNRIEIGARTNIQDGTVIHVDSGHGAGPGWPALIGEDVLVGHLAMIHGCVLEPHAFVGLGSIVMDGCVIESDGMLAAGALLTPGKRVGRGELWAGRPAKLLRALTETEIARNRLAAPGYAALAQAHRAAGLDATDRIG